jgi:hypothetical protein
LFKRDTNLTLKQKYEGKAKILGQMDGKLKSQERRSYNLHEKHRDISQGSLTTNYGEITRTSNKEILDQIT